MICSFIYFWELNFSCFFFFSVSTDPHRQAGGNNTRSPSTVESPSVSTVPNAIVPITEATANCRSCGHSGSQESFLQGKFCSAPCVQPTSGRYMFLALIEVCQLHCLWCINKFFCVCRSTPAEAFEGERLGKRVRKKKKMFMESGDEEEDNIEEEEVIHTHLTQKSTHSIFTGCSTVLLNVYLIFWFFRRKLNPRREDERLKLLD